MKKILQNVILMNIRIYIILFLFISPVLASETTVYLGSIEKTVETGEIKIYIPAGNATVMKVKNQVRYIYADHLGSTALTTDEQGEKTESYLYYPYGNPSTPSAMLRINPLRINSQTDKLYTSQRLDSSSDLYFYNARYYNPTIGNFISADKAQGPNRYSYVGNNPIMRNDPSGMVQGEFGDGSDIWHYSEQLAQFQEKLTEDLWLKYGLFNGVTDIGNKFYRSSWSEIEAGMFDWAASRMTERTDNKDLLKGIETDKVLYFSESSGAGYKYANDDGGYRKESVRIKGGVVIFDYNFNNKPEWWSKSTFIHEFAHVLAPDNYELFKSTLEKDGLFFLETKTKDELGTVLPAGYNYNGGLVFDNKVKPIYEYALNKTSDAFASFSEGYFAPELYTGQVLEYVFQGSPRTYHYANIGTVDIFKKLYPNIYQYLDNYYLNLK